MCYAAAADDDDDAAAAADDAAITACAVATCGRWLMRHYAGLLFHHSPAEFKTLTQSLMDI